MLSLLLVINLQSSPSSLPIIMSIIPRIKLISSPCRLIGNTNIHPSTHRRIPRHNQFFSRTHVFLSSGGFILLLPLDIYGIRILYLEIHIPTPMLLLHHQKLALRCPKKNRIQSGTGIFRDKLSFSLPS